MMEVLGQYCPRCYNFIYSRAQHDFHWCDCGGVAVDGGQENYGTRVCTNLPQGMLPVGLKVTLSCKTRAELYQDWNRSMNDLGVLDLFALSKYNTEIVDRTKKVAGATAQSRLYIWVTRNLPDEVINTTMHGVAMSMRARLSLQEWAYIHLIWAVSGRTEMVTPSIWNFVGEAIAEGIAKKEAEGHG